MIPIRRVAAPAVALLALAGAACGGDGEDDAGATATTGDAATTTEAAPTTTAGAGLDDPVAVITYLVVEGGEEADTELLLDILGDRLDSLEVDGFELSAADGRVVVTLGEDVGDINSFAIRLGRVGRLDLRPVLSVSAVVDPATCPVSDEPAVALDVQESSCYELGPVPTDGGVSLTGAAVAGAAAVEQQGSFVVELALEAGALDLFDATAAGCFELAPACPTGQLAIEVDGVVQSAPAIVDPSFDDGKIQISGAFTAEEAAAIAAVLQSGTLPVRLEVESIETAG